MTDSTPTLGKVIAINEKRIEDHLGELVREANKKGPGSWARLDLF